MLRSSRSCKCNKIITLGLIKQSNNKTKQHNTQTGPWTGLIGFSPVPMSCCGLVSGPDALVWWAAAGFGSCTDLSFSANSRRTEERPCRASCICISTSSSRCCAVVPGVLARVHVHMFWGGWEKGCVGEWDVDWRYKSTASSAPCPQMPGVDSLCSPMQQVRGGVSPSRSNASKTRASLPQVTVEYWKQTRFCRLLSRMLAVYKLQAW